MNGTPKTRFYYIFNSINKYIYNRFFFLTPLINHVHLQIIDIYLKIIYFNTAYTQHFRLVMHSTFNNIYTYIIIIYTTIPTVLFPSDRLFSFRLLIIPVPSVFQVKHNRMSNFTFKPRDSWLANNIAAIRYKRVYALNHGTTVVGFLLRFIEPIQ